MLENYLNCIKNNAREKDVEKKTVETEKRWRHSSKEAE